MSGPNTVIKYSFSTGEVAPGIYNRLDWQRIDGAVAAMRNGVVGPTGGSRKRPGLRFLNECLHDDKPITLVKFEFSKTQTYLLEFGDYVMRFYINREMILNADDTPYVVATPYSAEEARAFSYAQERDAMFFAHWDKPLKKLTRYGHANWAWGDVFKEENRIASPATIEFYDNASNGHNGYEYAVTAYKIESGTPKESISYPTVKSDPNDIKWIGEAPQHSIQSCIAWIKKYRPGYGGLAGFPTYPEAMDLADIVEDGYPPFEGQYLNSRMAGVYMTMYPGTSYVKRLWDYVADVIQYFWVVYDASGEKITFTAYWQMSTNGDPSTGVSLRSGAYAPNYTTFMRDNAIAYINGNNPVAGYTMSGIYNSIISFVTAYNTTHSYKIKNHIKWPAVAGASGYYVYRRPLESEDRSFRLVGTVADGSLHFEDADVEATVPGTKTPIVGANSFTSPDTYPNLVTFYQQRLVLGCTKAKPTSIFGSRTGIYTDFTINPSDMSSGYEFKMASQTSNPLEAILPLYTLVVLTSGGDFVSTVSGAMNASNVNFNQKSYNGAADVPPLILGDSGLYVPLNQQTIKAMTYSYEKDGFAHHNILFHAQHLSENKKVVRLAYQRDPINLIWALVNDGTLLSCLYIPEQDFIAWSRHDTRGAVDYIATVPTTEGNDEIYMVVKRTLGDGAVRQYLEVLEDMRPYGGTPTAETAFYVDCGLSAIFDSPEDEITGLEHLEGMEVAVLADWSVQERKTVQNGSITLDHPARAVHVGLPYEYSLKTIGFELLDQGTLRNTRSQVYQCYIEVADTRELLCAANGGEPAELIVHVSDDFGNPDLQNGDVKFILKARDTRRAYLEFSSPNPVPCEILSIVAEVEHGDS